MKLPLFINRSNKFLMGLICFGFAALIYVLSNHHQLFEAQQLPMWWIDRVTPFVPQTIYVYISEYLLFAVVYLICRDMENVNKYLYSFLALQIFSVTIFVLWPTTYPRDLFPLDPNAMDHLTYYVFSALRASDTPANCCPSLHVSSVYLSSFIFLDEQKKKFPWFFTWATLIGLSTLTTKQHYLIDVIVGLFLAIVFYWIFHKKVTYYRTAWAEQNNSTIPATDVASGSSG